MTRSEPTMILNISLALLYVVGFLLTESRVVAFVPPGQGQPSAFGLDCYMDGTPFSSTRIILGSNTNIRQIVRRRSGITTTQSNTELQATAGFRFSPKDESRRRELLGRNGPYFRLDRFGGKVEFGCTAKLVTTLNPTKPDLQTVRDWLSDERRVALSIWDEKLIKERGNQIFQLQLMTLQFVTIQLKPSVDVRMWTEQAPDGSPIFKLQSVAFEPNISLLPGVGVSAESLGIFIEVVGELQPTPDGKAVQGKITFVTSGKLPPPMRILPEPILKAASDTINETITQFAVLSFQKGATTKYREFLAARVAEKAQSTTA